MIEKEPKQLVINACKHIAKQSAEHLQSMIVLQKTDYSELATIKGLLDAVLIMIEELPEKEHEQTEREKELFQEKNLCHSFLIQENLMEQFQRFKERRTGGK
ncbi:MAG: hypothetical protein [Bacteriophage sp.]|nr:MAG: hypothetical protein [Bacteriophage sp.]